MKTVSGLMSGYFSESASNLIVEAAGIAPEYPANSLGGVPIEVTKSEWSILREPERMSRVYDFKGRPKALQYFVEDLLQFQEKLGHHAKITIEGSGVTVEVFTHGVQRITNLDKELAREADAIFADLKES